MPTARVNGITINYQIDGADSAETIVLINGLADDLESWGFQMPALIEAGYRVLRFDNRGIGKSDAPAGDYSARMLADDTKALVDQLGFRNFHLMGVTLACTYGKADVFCQTMFAMWADLASATSVAFVMRDVALWAFTGAFFEDRPDDVAEFAAAMAALPMSLDAYLSQLAVIQDHDATDHLAQIKVPTLVLAGEEDILIPVRLSKKLQQAIPGAQWATVPGGHACLWESPDPFNAAFLDFVRSTSR